MMTLSFAKAENVAPCQFRIENRYYICGTPTRLFIEGEPCCGFHLEKQMRKNSIGRIEAEERRQEERRQSERRGPKQ